MKWFVRLLIVIGVLILAMFIMGSALPEHHQASASRDFSVSRDTLWAVLTDFQQWPSWRSDLKQIQTKDNEFTEVTADDESIMYRIEEFTPPERLVTRIATPDLPFGGAWTYELTTTPTGCTLTITENGEVYNPMFRFIANYMIGHTSTMEKYLDDLSKKIK